MELHESLTLPVSLEDVLVAFADPTYQDLRAAHMGALSHQADIKAGGGELYIGVDWELPSTRVPAAARSLLGPTLVLNEVQRWHREGDRVVGTHSGTLRRADLTLETTASFAPTAEGCRKVISGTLTCPIPLLGRQVEAAAGPLIKEALHSEAATLAQWAQHRPELA